MLKTNRELGKYFFLSLITLGIYGTVFMNQISEDVNTIVSGRDGKHTMSYTLVLFFSVLTLGIVPTVWWYRITKRVSDELRARRLPPVITTDSYWGWYFFGSLILVGPSIYLSKLFKAMNMLCEDYNNEMLEARRRDSYDRPYRDPYDRSYRDRYDSPNKDSYDRPYKDPYDRSYRDSRGRSSRDTYDSSSRDSYDRYRR